MSLFRYPKSKHTRKQSPSSYKDYHKYKPFLQREFERKCIYCMLPDSLKGSDNFGVEHYKPKKKFPDLSVVYQNLFYACNCCNRRKGDFWPTANQLERGEFIPNPCDNVMFDHLRYDDHIVKGHSHTGQFTIEALDLNDAKSIEYRSFVFDLIKNIKANIVRINQTISEVDKRIAVAKESEKIELLEKKENHFLEEKKLNEMYSKLTGECC